MQHTSLCRRGSRAGQLLLLVVLGLAAACASKSYGTRRHEVTIESTPVGADLYIIRYTEWELGAGPAALTAYLSAAAVGSADTERAALLRLLGPFRVHEGVTPHTLSLIAHEHMIVAVKGTALARSRLMPRPNNEDDLVLRLAEPAGLSTR